MHKHFVANIVARNMLIVCLSMLAPLAWAWHDDSHSLEVLAFIKTIILGLVFSAAVLLIFRIKKDDRKRINAKDGLAIVGISWICLSAIGALPLYWAGVVSSYTDAYFEIVSGFTTTGSTIFSDIESLPRGILFWRSLTHWLGGMGIVVLYVALLPALGVNVFQLFKAEAPGITVERVEPSIRETAKKLWTIYFLLSFSQCVLLMLGDMPLFDALCHTFGTIATGGFSTKNASIGAYGPYIQWVIIVFMALAGVNFILHYLAFLRKPNPYFRDEEFRYYFFLIVALSIIFGAILKFYNIEESPFRASAFQIVAIVTTTGYVTADFDSWPHAMRFVLLMLMFIGGCGGSTGGGMKFVRVFLSVKIALRSIVQAVFPNAVMPIKFNAKPLPEKLVSAVLAYFMIFIHLLFLGTILFALTEHCDLETAFSASIAALSNIGPGLAHVGPMENYSWVTTQGKWLLTFLMLAGRLELYSILILFVPSAWRK